VNDTTDDGVEGFDACAGDAVLAEVEDLFLGRDQSAGEAGQFADSTLDSHGNPVGQAFVCAPAVGVGPDGFEGVLEQIDNGQVAVGGQQQLEFAAAVGAEVFGRFTIPAVILA
jgi:hypothetical protein